MTPSKPPAPSLQRTTVLLAASATLLALLALSGWRPDDRGAWSLEIFPVLIVLPCDKIGHFFQGFVPALVHAKS
jgi:uncharacterized membrane protein YjdF